MKICIYFYLVYVCLNSIVYHFFRMTSMITKEVLPVDVGEVAAADLEAVVCEVDLVEAVEVDSEEVKYKFIQF